jgi:hypothetical protein
MSINLYCLETRIIFTRHLCHFHSAIEGFSLGKVKHASLRALCLNLEVKVDKDVEINYEELKYKNY